MNTELLPRWEGSLSCGGCECSLLCLVLASLSPLFSTRLAAPALLAVKFPESADTLARCFSLRRLLAGGLGRGKLALLLVGGWRCRSANGQHDWEGDE